MGATVNFGKTQHCAVVASKGKLIDITTAITPPHYTVKVYRANRTCFAVLIGEDTYCEKTLTAVKQKCDIVIAFDEILTQDKRKLLYSLSKRLCIPIICAFDSAVVYFQ